MKKTVLLGVTSGIAAYKTLKLIQELRKDGIVVFVVMTDNAKKMISPAAFEKASGHKIYNELFLQDFDYKNILKTREVEHINLADKTDVMVIAPATANIIAKLAHGIADDFLTTTALAVTKPIILCPSMNVHMWHNPVLSENIAKLKDYGYHIINPAAGMLACGYEGVGRLADISDIKNEILNKLDASSLLKGQKILVTAGGTLEKIDTVRFIANRSSGKMGVALAEACYEKGADVLLLRAKNAVTPRFHIPEKTFTTANELLALMRKYAKSYDTFYHSAAVSDFIVEDNISGKLSSDNPVTLHLKPQIKILNQIRQEFPKIRLIAFKAAAEKNIKNLKKQALEKIHTSHADAIIANDITSEDRGFATDNNEVLIVLPDGRSKLFPLTSKKELARKIVVYMNSIFTSR